MRRTHAITAAAALIIAICLCALAQAQEDLVRRGVSLMNASQFQEAERTFRSAILKYPAAVVPRLFLGFILLHRNALSEAEQIFTQSLRADPENTTARLGLGMTLLQQGLPARAEEEFAKIRQNPDVSRSAQALHVRSLLLLGREDEALAEARRLADSYPSDAGYRRTVGTLCQMRGKQDEALDAFIQAVERDPFHVQTYLSIIAIYRLEENWTEAQQWSARALEIDQNHPLIYEELALACDRLGLFAAAEKAREDGRRTLQAEQLYNRASKHEPPGRPGKPRNCSSAA